jgi:hypothetical protein
MSFDLEPIDYLRMLKDEHREYRNIPKIYRKAINCCAYSNALPEIIFAKYGHTEPQKVQGTTSQGDYVGISEGSAKHTTPLGISAISASTGHD